MPKRLVHDRKARPPSPDPEVRASAGRIIDILQQLVISRPEMIIPLEEIVRGILVNLRVQIEAQIWQREEERRPLGRGALPPMPLSELPAMLALLEPPAVGKKRRKRSGKSTGKAKRR